MNEIIISTLKMSDECISYASLIELFYCIAFFMHYPGCIITIDKSEHLKKLYILNGFIPFNRLCTVEKNHVECSVCRKIDQ